MGTMGGCGAGAEQQAGLCPPVSLLPLAVLCNPVGALCFPIILLIFFFLMFYFFFPAKNTKAASSDISALC